MSAYLGTKSLSTSTRCGVRRSAVDELAQTQQASRKLHEETWAGLLQKPGQIPRRWKSFQGVLLQWLVLHVLILLLSHLGQAE